jgi:alanyl-tRNA synthetase
LATLVKARPDELPERIEGLMGRLRDAEKEIAKIRSASLTSNIEGVIGEGHDAGPFRVWTYRAPDGLSGGDLRDLAMRGRAMARPDRGVGMIGASVVDGKVALVAVVNPRALELGLTAKALLAAALPAVSGRGGGKDDVAQGGGTDIEGLDRAFGDVLAYVRSLADGA